MRARQRRVPNLVDQRARRGDAGVAAGGAEELLRDAWPWAVEASSADLHRRVRSRTYHRVHLCARSNGGRHVMALRPMASDAEHPWVGQEGGEGLVEVDERAAYPCMDGRAIKRPPPSARAQRYIRS